MRLLLNQFNTNQTIAVKQSKIPLAVVGDDPEDFATGRQLQVVGLDRVLDGLDRVLDGLDRVFIGGRHFAQ